jgi:DNA-binding NarL/FixJ family response regulator
MTTVAEVAQRAAGHGPTRIAIVDDQAVVREALAVMLDLDPDIDVVATATDGAQAVAMADQLRPDVILLDLTMPVLDGLGALRLIHHDHPDITILVLTTFAQDTSILAALHAGASGFLTKDANRGTILRAVREAVLKA